MQVYNIETKIENEIGTIITNLGYHILEVKVKQLQQRSQIFVVVHHTDGVTMDDCERISKIIYPRLQMVEELKDIALQVSSPGINRVLKTNKEYSIFQGRCVKIWLNDAHEWEKGTIDGIKNDILYIKTKEELKEIQLDCIKKAKLDDF